MRHFRIPRDMTGRALRAWISPSLLHLVTGPPAERDKHGEIIRYRPEIDEILLDFDETTW